MKGPLWFLSRFHFPTSLLSVFVSAFSSSPHPQSPQKQKLSVIVSLVSSSVKGAVCRRLLTDCFFFFFYFSMFEKLRWMLHPHLLIHSASGEAKDRRVREKKTNEKKTLVWGAVGIVVSQPYRLVFNFTTSCGLWCLN